MLARSAVLFRPLTQSWRGPKKDALEPGDRDRGGRGVSGQQSLSLGRQHAESQVARDRRGVGAGALAERYLQGAARFRLSRAHRADQSAPGRGLRTALLSVAAR